MKKLLSILLVIAMAATVFAGCKNDPTKNPSNTNKPTEPGTTDTAKPTDTEPGEATPTVDPSQVAQKNDIIDFNVLDTDDHMTRWNESAKEWLLENFSLRVTGEIGRVEAAGVGQYTVDTIILPTAETVETYREALELLFMQDSTYPDYMPSLYGTTQNCPAAKALGRQYMVDWTPYLGEGKALQSYVNWLWADDKDYWERAKKSLVADDGAIYALPRREMMSVSKFLAYNKSIFTDIGASWDNQPKTWDEFIALLESSKKVSSDIVPFIITEARLENALGFIASTYGLEFNANFDWTEKNGEPLWTYYWDDYLQILTKANELAEKGLTMNDKKQTNNIVHFDLNDTSAGRRAWAATNGWQKQGETGNAIAIYATSAIVGAFKDSGWSVGKSDWDIASNWIEQPGRQYSLIGGTQFAQSYVAMGRRINDQRKDNEFTLRICEFLSYSMNDAGYREYFFGQEGIPFGDKLEDCGNWVWDINPVTGEKAIRWSTADRFSFNIEKDERLLNYLNRDKASDDTTRITEYKRPDGITDEQFWINHSEHYKKLIEEGGWDKITIKGSPNKEDYEGGEGENKGDYSQYLSVDFGTKVFYSPYLYKVGTIMYGDITSYPMQMTVYWNAQESMASHNSKIENFKKQNTETNSYIYSGFYNSTSVLGSKAGEMEAKIKALKDLAKDFTIGFLGHTKTASDWNSYIQNLRDAGYEDVFKFYKSQAGTITTVTIKNDGTMSQSKVEEYRNNK